MDASAAALAAGLCGQVSVGMMSKSRSAPAFSLKRVGLVLCGSATGLSLRYVGAWKVGLASVAGSLCLLLGARWDNARAELAPRWEPHGRGASCLASEARTSASDDRRPSRLLFAEGGRESGEGDVVGVGGVSDVARGGGAGVGAARDVPLERRSVRPRVRGRGLRVLPERREPPGRASGAPHRSGGDVGSGQEAEGDPQGGNLG